MKKHVANCEPSVGAEMEVLQTVPLQFDEMVEDFLFRTRRILLVGIIDEVTSTHVCSYLQLLSTKKEPIYLYINSIGGCFSSGYSIIDQMLSCSCPVYTIVRGQAHSMGAIIAAFGQKGNRSSTPNSSMMIHSLSVQGQDQIEKHTNMMDYIRGDYRAKIVQLAKRLKVTSKQLINIMSDTMWMSPKEAMKIGLIDKIWTPGMERQVSKGLDK